MASLRWYVTPAAAGRAHRGTFGRLDDALDFAQAIADLYQATLFVWQRHGGALRKRYVIEPDLPAPDLWRHLRVVRQARNHPL